ncbi:L-serine ammonia-lyase, iron-sulfur-dependent, subunit alpha [Aminobacterium sp. MB27-C1]|uniref:L-serine ammonia-lyase, iron-sulfur-dependent, subunit alpha n=1 Tax=Aminobacterium sp. MB27-C1 TaxID=3070661 RepID=UPI0027DBED37|nr:L-serine ammonia-lyase, iron-sulfur-dependent, subunit alpha [Aminobacterium sp. MB27-C1]WMI71604.1 L-serine ammonia-lyase, iron-sulfur-dependent, subunit alpha [Aminobacterium sp. MB27-C1]
MTLCRNRTRLVSLFDSLGPIMTGPSSSHTAGVLRIGRMGCSFLGGEPEKVDLFFYGALAETYKGHMSDSAIVGGLLGMHEDSPEIGDALAIAEQKNIPVSYHLEPLSERNPNTVDMLLTDKKHSVRVVGISVGGGEILMTELEGYPISLRGSEDGVVFIAESDFSIKTLSEVLKVSVISCEKSVSSDSNVKDCLYTCLTEKSLKKEQLNELEKVTGIKRVFSLSSLLDYKLKDDMPLFSSFQGWIDYASSHQISLAEAAIAYETKRSGLTKEFIRSKIQDAWKVMSQSVSDGMKENLTLLGNLMPHDEGLKLMKLVEQKRALSGPTVGKSIARALGVMTLNGCMGCVVAAPTAGSCGVLSGALFTAAEYLNSESSQIEDALLVAAMVGALIAMRAPVSGALGGCQSEIGVASAMTASALAQLSGGSESQIVHAASLALKNILGLICDPVAGPVEIPCIKRNAIGVANAYAAGDMAVAGIESIIPPDEVVGALINVQKLLPVELRGSMRGGLASTPTAEKLKEKWFAKLAAKSHKS